MTADHLPTSPHAKDLPPTGFPPPLAPGEEPPDPWTILLVDDEPDILLSIKLLLERSRKGLKVITASSGAQGLEILRSRPVDLVISDYKMPGMDGIQFLVEAHQLKPDLPRVMFTAYADAELARRAVAEAFVREFIAKTLPPRELLQKVEALLED